RNRGHAVYGGVGMTPQEHALRSGVDVVVATPGRLLDHMSRRNVDFRGLQVLVLDEADRMLDMGFLPDVRRIVGALPRDRQTLLFSATMPPEIEALSRTIMRNPVRISVSPPHRPPSTIRHEVYPVPQHLKTSLLVRLLGREDMMSVLVFVRTKPRARRSHSLRRTTKGISEESSGPSARRSPVSLYRISTTLPLPRRESAGTREHVASGKRDRAVDRRGGDPGPVAADSKTRRYGYGRADLRHLSYGSGRFPRTGLAGMRGSEPGAGVRPLTTLMRYLLYAASVLVFLAGFQLTVFTAQTGAYFAWTVLPPITAAFLGAAYWAAVPVEVLAAREATWAK